MFIVVTVVWPQRATGSLQIQACLFTFFNVWVLATQIPYTVVTANHTAGVKAFLDGVQLPAQAIQEALAAAGQSDKYSELHFGML
jgi:hypothetical protein